MRLVIARCSVDYDGRLTAHLPLAVRLIMVKADGCVAVHADGGAYKPLNWMTAPNRVDEEPDRWVVTNPKGETLTIHLDEVLHDTTVEMGVDPGLQKDGVEAHLQELLAANPTAIGRRAPARPPRVPDRHRPGRPALPRRRRPGRRRRGEAARRASTASSS